MEPPNLKIAFGAHVPRYEVCKFITLTEGKYHHKRFVLNVSTESVGDDWE